MMAISDTPNQIINLDPRYFLPLVKNGDHKTI